MSPQEPPLSDGIARGLVGERAARIDTLIVAREPVDWTRVIEHVEAIATVARGQLDRRSARGGGS